MQIRYEMFWRKFVLRKRNQLLNPEFFGVNEIQLPRNSLIYYVPNGTDGSESGPSNDEPFISTYPDIINVEFNKEAVTPLGKIFILPFEIKKEINAYRKTHYNYNWARFPDNALRLEKQLFVDNLAMCFKGKRYGENLFTDFYKGYNKYATLMNEIKRNTERTTRYQFVRFELPNAIPAFTRLFDDYKYYKKFFTVNGEGQRELTAPNRQGLRNTRAYGCYYLMDLFTWLIGDYGCSQFDKLSDKDMEKLHFIFTKNNKALVIKLSTLKEWLDVFGTGENIHQKRLNVTKRFLLVMKTLVDNGISDSESAIANETPKPSLHKKEEDLLSSDEEEGEETGKGNAGSTENEDTDESTVPNNNPDNVLDIFDNNEGRHKLDNQQSSGEGTGSSDNKSGEPLEEEDEVTTTEQWDDEVDDALLENAPIESIQVITKVDSFPEPISGIEYALNDKASSGVLTVAERDYFIKQGNSYKSIKMKDGKTLEEFVNIPDELVTDLEPDLVADIPTVLDKSMLKSTTTDLKTGYVKKLLAKDLASCVLAVQNGGIALTDFKEEQISNANGNVTVYKMSVNDVNGGKSTLPFTMPTVNEKDGTFTVDGVKYVYPFQRMEIPIRKISPFKVALTSYFDKKLMVKRSENVADDYGYWLSKQIFINAEDGLLKSVLGNVLVKEVDTPRIYSILAKRFTEIKTKEYNFNFDYAKLKEEYPDLIKPTSYEYAPIGVHNGKVLAVDNFGEVRLGDEELGTVESLLGVNTSKAPIEFVQININGYLFPIGIVLSYFLGFDTLVKTLNCNFRTVIRGDKLQLMEDEFALKFMDETLIFSRRDQMATYVLGGMRKLTNMGNFTRNELNNPEVLLPLMGDTKVKPTHFSAMKLIYDFFIDPITKKELIRLGYPTSIPLLLLEAVKMLRTDNTKADVELSEQRIVGYERFVGHFYGQLVKSVRQQRNKGTGKKQVLEMNPNAVMMSILTDTSKLGVEDANPIHELKTQEELTFGGTGGRSETTMVRKTRGQNRNYKGIISEAQKDSGKVGFVTYLTSNAKVVDYRGNVDTTSKPENSSLGSVAMNLMYGGTKDDQRQIIVRSIYWVTDKCINP